MIPKSNGFLSLAPYLLIAFVANADFTDISDSTGISYIHSLNTDSIENHAGAAAVDVNGDGFTDILAARFNKVPLLYINNGNGTFTEQGSARGISIAQDAASFGAGDLDNDGDQDLVMAPHDGNRFFLFINDGAGNFSEQAIFRGAAIQTSLHNHQAYSISLVDYDIDGYLDIYISEGSVPTSSEDSSHSVLLRNRGGSEPAFFDNATAESGLIQPVKGDVHRGFSTAFADFDSDGFPDLAMIKDFRSSQMYWNNGDGTFSNDTAASGTAKDEFGMGVAVIDYNRDGLLDFYVTSIWDAFNLNSNGSHTGNKLYRNLGNRRFAEVAEQAGVENTFWGWGTAAIDYDNNGISDLIATNGSSISEGADPNFTPYVPANTDPTTLFRNNDDGTFSNISATAGLADVDLGKGLILFDMDNDGDEDVFIANTRTPPVIYRSDASENGNHWIRFKLQGVFSNRDGIGALLRASDDGETQTKYFNPTNSFIGQHESFVHFGLGNSDGSLDELQITWPNGTLQTINSLSTNQLHTIIEPEPTPIPPVFTQQPEGGSFTIGDSLTLSIKATGTPEPNFAWMKNDQPIPGETSSTLRLKRVTAYDAGIYSVKATNAHGEITSEAVEVSFSINGSSRSVARLWNEFLMEAIRKDFPDPTKHARNLYHISAAMWDAYWAYQENGWNEALPIFSKEEISSQDAGADRLASQAEAISYAAYRILLKRYENSPGAEASLFNFRWLMQEFGYEPDFQGTDENTPAEVGNRIGNAVLAAGLLDGSNEANQYADTSGYEPSNEPLLIDLDGITLQDANRWQPLAFDFLVTQNGIPIGEAVQEFLGVNWREVDTFAIAKPTNNTIALDPGPPPLLGTATEPEYLAAANEVIRFSSWLDPNSSTMIDVSPGARLNNRLGSNEGIGRPLNPATGQPYPPNIVNLADYGRILAEFWADGPASETPPGHWNTLHNEIVDHPLFERRFAGQGSELSKLEWDVQAYLALNGAMHDAAVAAWTLKRQYDYVRPLSIIRHLGSLGQSSDPQMPSYHEQGLILEPGLVEIITSESAAPGQRHAALADHIGEVAIFAWAGEPEDAENEVGGVEWILPESWLPYQRDTFVTPAFAAYISGHSTFSRAGAEVMTLLTGSPYFPGGMGEFHFEKNEFLEFEDGPSDPVTLQWATYYDAADQAGISRLYGGIHVRADDFVGRVLGAQIGTEAFLMSRQLRYGAQPAKGLVNISTRGQVGDGEKIMISGFVADNMDANNVLLRSVGPELANFGITAPLPDPQLQLFANGTASPLASNDNWNQSSFADEITTIAQSTGAFPLSEESRDAAELVLLDSGIYSLQTSGTNPQGKIALAEVYGENFLNISTRAIAGQGENTLIAGFVLKANEPTTVLIRGIGPTLSDFGVSDTLNDPVITLFKVDENGNSTQIGENDDWIENERASLAQVSGNITGAFPLSQNSKDAALIVQLPSGSYSVHLSGKENETGVGLVEVYHVK